MERGSILMNSYRDGSRSAEYQLGCWEHDDGLLGADENIENLYRDGQLRIELEVAM
jgi:hypothetical protein